MSERSERISQHGFGLDGGACGAVGSRWYRTTGQPDVHDEMRYQ